MIFSSQDEMDEYTPYSKSLGDLYVETMKELAIPYPSIELPGWNKFNELTGGLRMREFTILCGATGAGKTTLLSSWAKSVIECGKRCFVMSVETGHTDFVKRMMSAFCGSDLNRGVALPADILTAFHAQHGKMFSSDKMYLSLYDNRIDHEIVMKDILWHREKKNCQVVFIDNLNFLLEVVSQNRQIEVMDKVVHDLIMLTKRTDIHLVLVMHPKKTENGNGGRVESEFDIKGSSTAVQEAHNVLLFNRPKPNDTDHGTFLRELIFRKLRRRGESMGKSIWLRYQGASYREQ